MSFQIAVNDHFPGALDQRELVSTTSIALQRAGFTTDNTLMAVARCRDEVAGGLTREIERVWGSAFELASLSGMLSGGTSAITAALAHRPRDRDQSYFVLFAMAHVGFDEDGVVGRMRRPGIDQPVPTCGSLAAASELLGPGRGVAPRPDPFDLEQGRVVQRLSALSGSPGPPPDLAGMAKLALRCIEDDIEAIFDRQPGGRRGRPLGIDGALITGVQIHGRYDRNLIWPSTAVVDLGGRVTPIFDAGRQSGSGRRPARPAARRARSATWPARRTGR